MDSAYVFEKAIWNTEVTLFGDLRAKVPQVPMWLDLSSTNECRSSELSLRPICTEEHWEIFKQLRTEIEIPFGITDANEIEKILIATQRIMTGFPANWYLAVLSDRTVVGSIGLVEIQSTLGLIGRLLDVDIAPRFQGRGYGNNLMHAIVEIARKKELKALCLKADSHRWVKDWYGKLGFQEVGLWQPKSGTI